MRLHSDARAEGPALAGGSAEEQRPAVTICHDGQGEKIGSLIRLRGYCGPHHEHSEAQIALIFSHSSGLLSQEDRAGRCIDEPMPPGFVAYFPPGARHCVQWTSFSDLLNIYWTEESLRELADQSGCTLPPAVSEVRADSAIQSVGVILRDDFYRLGDLSPMLVDHARALMAARMFRTFDQGMQRTSVGLLSKRRMRAAIEAIATAPEKHFTLVELARMCNSSVFHFSHSFTARMGAAPFAFQRQMRMQKAAVMLTSTELSVEKIGSAVGMDSSTSFSRLFKRLTGESPLRYRQNRSTLP